MQFFELELGCGHKFETVAVDQVADKASGELTPYEPNYVGQDMPARCCGNSHKVTAQRKIPRPSGTV